MIQHGTGSGRVAVCKGPRVAFPVRFYSAQLGSLPLNADHHVESAGTAVVGDTNWTALPSYRG